MVNEQESERDGQSSNQDQHARFQIALQTILKKRACDWNWRQIFNAYRFGARAYFKDEQRNNILMLACMAHQSKNRRIELVKIILENHPLPTEADLQISRSSRKDIAQQCNKKNKTALMIAQANGDIEISDLINARLAEIDAIQQRANTANSKQQEKNLTSN